MRYTELSTAEGKRFLAKIWNLIFKPLSDEEFFVEPWENRELRDCARFMENNDVNEAAELLFFVADEKLISFLRGTKEVYLLGAYNQINVCQMRARGTVALDESLTELEREKLKAELQSNIEVRQTSAINALDENEVRVRLPILANGLVFRFRPTSYSYSMYERG